MNKTHLHVLVVDDIRLERAHLRKLVESHDASLECAEAQDGIEALQLLQQGSFDILFLDIRMPGLNGIEVAWKIKELPEHQRPLVIFATAYDEYAKEGFKLNAVHYITKPYKQQDVCEAISRAINEIEQNDPQQRWQNFFSHFASVNGRMPGVWAISEDEQTDRLVLFGEIAWIYIENKQVFLNAFIDNKWVRYRLKHKSLKDIGTELQRPEFVRVSQSHIVNVNYILKRDKYGRNNGREIVLMMRDAPKNSSIVVGATYVRLLKGFLL